MFESITVILTKFTDETITISLLVALIVLTILVAYWVYNRKKFQLLKHQIPAAVVNSYLDSIIQNSNSLKSSLFRGGGFDPSVMPTSQLPQGESVGLSEDSSRLIAEIASLKTMVDEKTSTITDLEKKLSDATSGGMVSGAGLESLEAELAAFKEKLRDSEEQIKVLEASGGAGEGGDAALEQKLKDIQDERDSLQERLMEYEIIEEDLANLKRLQQENAELRAALESGAAPAKEAAPEPAAPEPAAEEQPVVEEEPPAKQDSVDELVAAELEAKQAEEPVAEEPVAEEPVAEEPVAEEPVAEEPAVEELAAEAPAVEEAAAEEPVAEAPPVEEPVAEAPAPAADSGPSAEEIAVASAEEAAGAEGSPIPDSEDDDGAEQKSAEELLSEFEKMLG